VNWRENTIQILASIRPEDKEQFEKVDEQKTNEEILIEAELLTPPDVILKQVIKEEFTEWGEWSECKCGEKERIKINSNYKLKFLNITDIKIILANSYPISVPCKNKNT
jgi:hypothetical protein